MSWEEFFFTIEFYYWADGGGPCNPGAGAEVRFAALAKPPPPASVAADENHLPRPGGAANIGHVRGANLPNNICQQLC